MHSQGDSARPLLLGLRHRDVNDINADSGSSMPSSSAATSSGGNYVVKQLLLLVLAPILIFLPYLAMTAYGLSDKDYQFYHLSPFQWTLFVLSLALSYLLLSLVARLIMDLVVEIVHTKYKYLARVVRRARNRIIMSLFLVSFIVIFDVFTPAECVSPGRDFASLVPERGLFSSISSLVGLSSDSGYLLLANLAEKLEQSVSKGEASCIYTFGIARKILLCALVSFIALSLTQVVVKAVSILYQDNVYRDRIILNRYHLFVTQLLFSAAKAEGAKRGLLYAPAAGPPKRPMSSFFKFDENDLEDDPSGQGEEDDDREDGEEEYGSQVQDDDYDDDDEERSNRGFYRRETVSAFQATQLLGGLRHLFARGSSSQDSPQVPSDGIFPLPMDRLADAWMDFKTFKRKLHVFGPDFSIRPPSVDAGLSTGECKQRAKFIHDVLSHGKTPSVKSRLDESKSRSHVFFKNWCGRGSGTGAGDAQDPLLPPTILNEGSDLRAEPLAVSDFKKIFRSDQAACEVYSVFDLNLDGHVSRSEMKQVFVEIHREYKNLIQSVFSSAEALRALDISLSVAVFLVLAFVYGIIWGANVSSMLTLSLSFILALNVVVGEWAKDAFDSLMYLFVCHPFDIGDQITIEGFNQVFTVSRIYVLKTALRDATGTEVYMPNPALLKKSITNCRRSNEQWEFVRLNLGSDTSDEQIYAFRARLVSFLKEHPHLFHGRFEPESSPLISENLDVIVLVFRVPCKLSLDGRKRAEKHRLLQTYIRGDLEKLGISHYPKGPGGPLVTFEKERAAFCKAFQKAAKKDPLLAEDVAGSSLTSQEHL